MLICRFLAKAKSSICNSCNLLKSLEGSFQLFNVFVQQYIDEIIWSLWLHETLPWECTWAHNIYQLHSIWMQFGIPSCSAVFKMSAGPWTLTGKTVVGPAGFPSLPCLNFDKILLLSSKFQILFWRLVLKMILTSVMLILLQWSHHSQAYQCTCGACEALQLPSWLLKPCRGHREQEEGCQGDWRANHHQENCEWYLMTGMPRSRPNHPFYYNMV